MSFLHLGLRLGSALFAGLLILSEDSLAETRAINVIVEGVKSQEGRIYVALHHEASRDQFPQEENAVSGIWCKAKQGDVRVVFADIDPGVYAVAAYHDANSDKTLNNTILGIPLEGFGFSNNKIGFMGPPAFADTAFTLDGSNKTIRFTLNYPDN